MPRISYEQHRANKVVEARRRGSILESETDLDSLASFSTQPSTSSAYGGYPSPRLSHTLSASLIPPPRDRTLSTTSQTSSAWRPELQSAVQERRDKRRREREAKSTLLALKYDSPLRRWLRIMSKNGWSGMSLAVGLAAVGLVKIAVELSRAEEDVQEGESMGAVSEVAEGWFNSTSEGTILQHWSNLLRPSGISRLATFMTIISLIPTTLILLYSSCSLRSVPEILVETTSSPSTNSSAALPPSTINLLPVALFTSSLSVYLVSLYAKEESIVLPLMPLCLLMALRGGSARGAEGVGTEDEIWEFGVLISNVAALGLGSSFHRDISGRIVIALTTLLWNYVIGYSPFSLQTTWIRSLGYVVYPIVLVLQFGGVVWRDSEWIAVASTVLSFGVYLRAWLWGTKKLVEGAWAIGGFSAGSKGTRDRGRKKVD
ncbi:hypothetical protein P7C73_g3661, partial [Tremellales sp. Uapishka_1]